MTTEVAGQDLSEVDERALDAAGKVLERYLVASENVRPDLAKQAATEMFAASSAVYDEAEDPEVQRLMDETLFAGMDVNERGDVQLRIKLAVDMAKHVTNAFRTLLKHRGGENYLEMEQTFTDPENYDKFRVVIIKPGRPSPHQLRQQAERQRDELVEVLGQTIAALNVALDHTGRAPIDPDDDEQAEHERNRREDLAGCREALRDATASYEAAGGKHNTDAAATPA